MDSAEKNAKRKLIQVHDLGVPASEFQHKDYLDPNELSPLQRKGCFVVAVSGEFMRANTAQMGSEKPTMPIPNPGLLKGLLEQFYYHPNSHIAIERFAVMNEVRKVDMVCNELETTTTVRAVQRAQKLEGTGLDVDFSVSASEPRQQRSITYLREQEYIVVARICAKKLGEGDGDIPTFGLSKAAHIFKRRLVLGQNYYHTYLGTKECMADVTLCTLEDLARPSYYDGMTIALGRMPFMADYRDPAYPVWYQYEPVMVNGTIQCPEEREVMGDAAYT